MTRANPPPVTSAPVASLLAEVAAAVERARSLRNSDPAQGIRIASEALAQARALAEISPDAPGTIDVCNARTLLADVLTALGHCERMTSALTDSAAHCSEAASRYAALNVPHGEAVARTQWGIALVQLGDLPGGLAQLERSRDISHALGDAQKESDALIDIGIVHNMLGDDARAIQLYQQALPVYEANGDRYHTATCLNNMAYAHVCWGERVLPERPDEARGHFARAAELAAQALPLARACDHIDFVATCLNTLSQAQRLGGDLDACMATLREQLAISGQLVSRRMEAVCQSTLAEALLARDHDGDLAEAVRLLQVADQLCTQHQLRESHPPILELLAQALEKQGDLGAALAAHRRFHALQMAVNSEAAEREAKTLESRLRLERTQAELENASQRERELAALNAQLREQRAELERYAHIDALTNLANRRAWLSGLNDQWTDRSNLYLLLLDVDYFKAINDDWGHAVGDSVLTAVAECVRDTIGSAGECGRFGGEEFVAWCRVHDPARMARLVDDVLARVRGFAWQPLAPNLRVTASVGWTPANAHLSVEAALAEADRCMYDAKRRGRNRAVGTGAGD